MNKRLASLMSIGLLILAGCGGRLPPTPQGASNQAVILSPTQNTLYVFNLLTHRVDFTIPTGTTPQDLALGQGGLIFVSNALENSFSSYLRADPLTWYRIGKVGTVDAPGRLTYSSANQELYLLAADVPRLSVYRVSGRQRPVQQQVVRLDDTLSKPSALALASDGQTLYVAGSQKLQSLSRANDKLSVGQTLDLPEHSDISDVALAGDRLILSDRANDQLLVIDTASFKQTATINLAQGDTPILPERMALNHAGTKLYVTGSGASVVQVIDVQNQKLLQTLQLSGADVHNPAAAPVGVAVLGNDREVYVTARSGRNLALLETNPDVGQDDSIARTLGTSVHEALLPPLGDIAIF